MIKRSITLLLLTLLTACSQWWPVRPYSDFINAEIAPGDQIRIETVGGKKSKMTVESIEIDRINGQNGTVLLKHIVSLEKYAKEPAANPCSPGIPLGCSVPRSITVLSATQAKYEDFFYPSCEQHDYCYRHGAATYGEDQNSCDEKFLADMEDQCSPDSFTSVLLQSDLNFGECSATAIAYYHSVRQYGANRFSNRSTSTYCEYDGPP